ncbi:MAG: hypothetical protein HYW91_02095 [Candidatus Sungbacteria bacterium]|nr:hypothetical protein [Candidatus Sungbacteria bacterium]
MEAILEKLFESVPKVKILRPFMRNPEYEFTFQELMERSQVRARSARTELKKLLRLGIVKNKLARIQYEVRPKSRFRKKPPLIVHKTKKARVFYANQDFPFLTELRNLITKASVASRKKLHHQINGLGKVKLAILAGVFINNDNSRTDLFIVGDAIKRGKLENFLSKVESELGRPLQYTVMDTKEFKYRLDMYDRFLRDILEYPHEKLINKLHI